MPHAQIRWHCAIDSTVGRFFQQAMEELHLSTRAYDHILNVARTIAYLAIAANHLLEAIRYRSLDRNLFYSSSASDSVLHAAEGKWLRHFRGDRSEWHISE
jgi:magnesium chelatase family protein